MPPTYDFKCATCGEVFEVFEQMSKVKREVECPKCGKSAKRQIGRGAHPILPTSSGFMPYRGT